MHKFLQRLYTEVYISIALLVLFEVFIEVLCIQWWVWEKKKKKESVLQLTY